MKKRINLILCVLIVVALLATVFVGCVPENKPTKEEVKYAVTPLADLTDYSSTANKQPVYYTTSTTEYTEARNNLEAKIKTQKSYYDAYAAGESTYLKYDGKNLNGGTEEDIDGEQSSLLKILAHADADQLIYVLGYSGLAQDKMISLISYIAEDGTGAADEANISKATGLIEDYEAIREWSDIVDRGTSTAAGQTAYKNRARKSRAMNKRLFDTGMDGGDAGRAILEVFEYVQIVTEEMRATYNEEHVGAILDNMTEYFKKELLDYDTVVLIRANNYRRWGNAGQGKTAMNKEVKYDVEAHSYEGSYSKPTSTSAQTYGDAGLVQAYGYSFEYERGNYNALNDTDFEKELTYRFATKLSNDEAKDYSRIQRTQYEKAFRYSEAFYNKYYTALDPINVAQETYEGAVFGFNNSDRVNGDRFDGASSTIKVQGVGGNETEETISVDLGGDTKVQNRDKNKNFYADMSYQAIKIGLHDQLIAGDMQHYYWGIEQNVLDQNNANNDRMSDNAGTQAKGNFNLKIVNLKMADFVLSTFVDEKNTGGLANLMKAQTRLYLADYARLINAYRRQVVRELAKLEKEGVLVARVVENSNSKEIVYDLANGAYTPEQQITVRDNIGRAAAMIKNLNNKRSTLDVDSKDTTLLSTDWKVISDQIKATVNYNYNELGVANWGAKSKKLDDVLIHKDENGKYDTNWATSVFVNNNSQVLAYSSGQVALEFRVGNRLSNDGKVEHAPYKDIVYGYSGEQLTTIISAHDDGEGLTFSALTANTGSATLTATPQTDEYYYLVCDDQTGKYYYKVLTSDIVEYDLTLFVYYKVQ